MAAVPSQFPPSLRGSSASTPAQAQDVPSAEAATVLVKHAQTLPGSTGSRPAQHAAAATAAPSRLQAGKRKSTALDPATGGNLGEDFLCFNGTCFCLDAFSASYLGMQKVHHCQLSES